MLHLFICLLTVTVYCNSNKWINDKVDMGQALGIALVNSKKNELSSAGLLLLTVGEKQ